MLSCWMKQLDFIEMNSTHIWHFLRGCGTPKASLSQNSVLATSLYQYLLLPPQTEQPLVWLWSTSWSHAEVSALLACLRSHVVHRPYKGVCHRARRFLSHLPAKCIMICQSAALSSQSTALTDALCAVWPSAVMWLLCQIIGCGLAEQSL